MRNLLNCTGRAVYLLDKEGNVIQKWQPVSHLMPRVTYRDEDFLSRQYGMPIVKETYPGTRSLQKGIRKAGDFIAKPDGYIVTREFALAYRDYYRNHDVYLFAPILVSGKTKGGGDEIMCKAFASM